MRKTIFPSALNLRSIFLGIGAIAVLTVAATPPVVDAAGDHRSPMPVARRSPAPETGHRRIMAGGICLPSQPSCPVASPTPPPTPKPTATPVPTSCSFNGITAPPNQSVAANAAPPLISGSVTVTCSNGAPYNIEMSPGLHGSDGSSPTRNVANGGNLLGYGIYRATCTCAPWGDTIGTNTQAGTGTGGAQAYTIYLQFNTPSYTLPSGAYSDTVTVTIAY